MYGNAMMLENSRLMLRICPEEAIFALTDKRTGACFLQSPGEFGFRFADLTRAESALVFSLIQGSANLARCELTLADNFVQLSLEGMGPMEELAFPAAWRGQKGDLCLYPIGTGVCFPAEDSEFPIPEWLDMLHGHHLSMAMWGMQRGNTVLFSVLERCTDARLHTLRPHGLPESGVVWLSQKGDWGYRRVMRFYLAGSVAEACACVRSWREQLGYVRTLREKMAHTPEVEKLLGAADIWLWDDNNMNRLYARPEQPEKTPRDVRRIAREMLELGFDRVLWNSFEGETPEDCRFLKEQGWLVGKYDIYRDVIPEDARKHVIPYRLARGAHHFKNWPDDVRMERDGQLSKAWQLHTVDGNMCYQNSICDLCALKMTMEDVPPDVKRVGYNSRFIDVQGGFSGSECWHPMHPCTREDSRRYICQQTEFLGDMGLVAGVEAGQEGAVRAYHFSEGTISPLIFRQDDAGRRMNAMYYGKDVPPQISGGMLNAARRLPLWDLVYHDCAVNYWYWGDSSNCCPEWMPVRDLFDALYGYPPLYSLSASQWEQIKDQVAASYRRATATARKVALLPMTGFDWLTPDRLVQRTVFGGRYTVTANFSQEPFSMSDGSVLPAGAWRMDAIGGDDDAD